MKRPLNPEVADSRTKLNSKKITNPYSKADIARSTSVNGNRNTQRKPITNTKRAKKV
jgi:hypothetical protein